MFHNLSENKNDVVMYPELNHLATVLINILLSLNATLIKFFIDFCRDEKQSWSTCSIKAITMMARLSIHASFFKSC